MEWINAEPTNYLNKVKEILGEPSVIIDKPRGAAIWYPQEYEDTLYGLPSIFEKHMLVDEVTFHACPVPHKDFFFSFVKVLISFRQLNEINNLTGAIGYDKISKKVWVKCSNLETNIVTLKLATDIILQKVNLNKIRRENLYKKAILKASEDPDYTKLAYKSLYDNIQEHYKLIASDDVMSSEFYNGYWSGAFNSDCTRPSGWASLGRALGLQTGRGKNIDKEKVKKGKDQAVEKLKKMEIAREKTDMAAARRTAKDETFSSRPWYAESNPWYATNQPLNWYLGSQNDKGFVPCDRESQKAHVKTELFSNHPYYCLCRSCRNMEHLESRPIHDSRFLQGTASRSFTYGDDINSINRTYGTAAQKRDYPRYTDFIKSIQ